MLKDPLILYYFGFPLILLVQAIIFLIERRLSLFFGSE